MLLITVPEGQVKVIDVDPAVVLPEEGRGKS